MGVERYGTTQNATDPQQATTGGTTKLQACEPYVAGQGHYQRLKEEPGNRVERRYAGNCRPLKRSYSED